jgi:peptide/nickel transport system permease protein
MRSLAARNPTVVYGGAILVTVALFAAAANWVSGIPPTAINVDSRLAAPSLLHWFGGDALGRSLWSRTLWGGQISLFVGVSVVALSTAFGLVIGLLAGYFRALDSILMRVMDGLMAIPGVLLAIALMTLTRSSVKNVIIAVTITEIPRVVRLVRAMVLSIREQPYVEAAIASGGGTARIIFRHILPNALAPLGVQATYVCASAIIAEAYLSFLGAGTPPEIPSWGNIMAEGRVYFQIAPWIILIPGTFVALTVLAMNILGDGLRDMLDPRIARRI